MIITLLTLLTLILLVSLQRRLILNDMKEHKAHPGYRVEIRDARKGRFRVRSVASNNETLQTSEVLNTPQAVVTHIRAMTRVYSSSTSPEVIDRTRLKQFSDIRIHFSEDHE